QAGGSSSSSSRGASSTSAATTGGGGSSPRNRSSKGGVTVTASNFHLLEDTQEYLPRRSERLQLLEQERLTRYQIALRLNDSEDFLFENPEAWLMRFNDFLNKIYRRARGGSSPNKNPLQGTSAVNNSAKAAGAKSVKVPLAPAASANTSSATSSRTTAAAAGAGPSGGVPESDKTLEKKNTRKDNLVKVDQWIAPSSPADHRAGEEEKGGEQGNELTLVEPPNVDSLGLDAAVARRSTSPTTKTIDRGDDGGQDDDNTNKANDAEEESGSYSSSSSSSATGDDDDDRRKEFPRVEVSGRKKNTGGRPANACPAGRRAATVEEFLAEGDMELADLETSAGEITVDDLETSTVSKSTSRDYTVLDKSTLNAPEEGPGGRTAMGGGASRRPSSIANTEDDSTTIATSSVPSTPVGADAKAIIIPGLSAPPGGEGRRRVSLTNSATTQSQVPGISGYTGKPTTSSSSSNGPSATNTSTTSTSATIKASAPAASSSSNKEQSTSENTRVSVAPISPPTGSKRQLLANSVTVRERVNALGHGYVLKTLLQLLHDVLHWMERASLAHLWDGVLSCLKEGDDGADSKIRQEWQEKSDAWSDAWTNALQEYLPEALRVADYLLHGVDLAHVLQKESDLLQCLKAITQAYLAQQKRLSLTKAVLTLGIPTIKLGAPAAAAVEDGTAAPSLESETKPGVTRVAEFNKGAAAEVDGNAGSSNAGGDEGLASGSNTSTKTSGATGAGPQVLGDSNAKGSSGTTTASRTEEALGIQHVPGETVAGKIQYTLVGLMTGMVLPVPGALEVWAVSNIMLWMSEDVRFLILQDDSVATLRNRVCPVIDEKALGPLALETNGASVNSAPPSARDEDNRSGG
ncbi:unnamed protein product, partial [Amoebophrya sp. A25]